MWQRQMPTRKCIEFHGGSRLQICPTFQVPCPSPNPSAEFAFVCWTCLLAGPQLGTGIPCCWDAEEANFGTRIDVVAALAKIRIKFMHFCCSVLCCCWLAQPVFQAEPRSWPSNDDDDDDGTDDDTLPCSVLLCRLAIAIGSFRVHPAQVSPRLPETWQGTAQCFKAKKNQLKENKLTHIQTHTHTLTFAHEQTKRFAQFWLWFCN